MKINDLTVRVDELIKLGESTLGTVRRPDYGGDYVDTGSFAEFRSASLSFLARVFGSGSPLYVEFLDRVTDISDYYTQRGIGILKAARAEMTGGWLTTTKGLVSAEVFSDFLGMAEHLLSEKYKDPAAVVVGAVLEEHIRQLCQKRDIPTAATKSDGRVVSHKADFLNAELAKAGAYSGLDQKNVTAWLDLRNKAAHGHYSEYTSEQVALMLHSVSDFIVRTPI